MIGGRKIGLARKPDKPEQKNLSSRRGGSRTALTQKKYLAIFRQNFTAMLQIQLNEGHRFTIHHSPITNQAIMPSWGWRYLISLLMPMTEKKFFLTKAFIFSPVCGIHNKSVPGDLRVLYGYIRRTYRSYRQP